MSAFQCALLGRKAHPIAIDKDDVAFESEVVGVLSPDTFVGLKAHRDLAITVEDAVANPCEMHDPLPFLSFQLFDGIRLE